MAELAIGSDVQDLRPAQKTCRGPCKQTKPLDEFDIDRSRPDGRRRICKACRAKDRAKIHEVDKKAALHRDALLVLARRYPEEFRDILTALARHRGLLPAHGKSWRPISL